MQNALTSLAGYQCPTHQTRACTCQYIVLLLRDPSDATALLVAFGRDDWSWSDIRVLRDIAGPLTDYSKIYTAS